MTGSTFYDAANRALSEECQRLLAFTAQMDGNPQIKKVQMADYKCAMYRYAAISNVQARMMHAHRLRATTANTHYIPSPLEELLLLRPDLLAEYEKAADKPAAGLYLGIVALADQKIAEQQDVLARATDWEAVELTERLDGYQFALRCLHDAWKEAAK